MKTNTNVQAIFLCTFFVFQGRSLHFCVEIYMQETPDIVQRYDEECSDKINIHLKSIFVSSDRVCNQNPEFTYMHMGGFGIPI